MNKSANWSATLIYGLFKDNESDRLTLDLDGGNTPGLTPSWHAPFPIL